MSDERSFKDKDVDKAKNRLLKLFVYNIALHILALMASCLLFKEKYRKRLSKRLGNGFPKIEKEGRPLIWIHAVSLGETKAVGPLLKKLKMLPTKPKILLTTVTETGLKEGSGLEADYRAYLPLDFSYVIKPIVKRVSPDLLILTESDLWLNFQTAVKKCGGKVVLINGKLSESSYKRFLKVRFFAKKLFSTIDLFLVQNDLYEKRFSSLGVSKEKIKKTGNIKLDGISFDVDIESWKQKLHLSEQDIVLTVGSTHDPEEKIFLNIAKKLFVKFPNLKILLVPRHPERFEKVASLLEENQMDFGRLSFANLQNKRVLFIDAMGHLRKCYQCSQLAFVGGSLTDKVGGHNILEPSFYGVPVLFGPYMHTQPDFLDLIRSYQAGESVSEETLLDTCERYLKSEELRKKVGNKGLKLIEESRGALEQTFHEIRCLL